MIIVYGDSYCTITKRECDRGSIKECPKKNNNLEVPCKHFRVPEKEDEFTNQTK
jgi:hypothetical protein